MSTVDTRTVQALEPRPGEGAERQSTESTGRQREFAYDDQDFEAICLLVKNVTGIHLTSQKRELVG